MKIVVDTNIVFSAVLNSNARIAQILLSPKKRARFYSTNQLLSELQKHQTKLKNIAGYGDEDLARIISIVTKHIQFIDVRLISEKSYATALVLTRDVVIDDTEFVALTEHLRVNCGRVIRFCLTIWRNVVGTVLLTQHNCWRS